MPSTEKLDTHHKALPVNLDPSTFGSFAEIGAGQEVARWFLVVGGASDTVAKSISAYAGIKVHFRLYDLRHTFATRSVAAGVNLPTLSAILGHTSIQMTMRYVHPAEEQKRLAAGKLENFRIAGIVEAMEKSR